MKIICHRLNSSSLLNGVKKDYGAEIDIRYHKNELVLHHDPFHSDEAESFFSFLTNYDLEGTLILNLKTEGIEDKCISLMSKFNVKSWFFLDMSQPYLVRYANNLDLYKIKNENLAIRYSDFEPIEYALSFKNKVSWVWIDRFKENCLNDNSFKLLKDSNFKICLVSPELQGDSIDSVNEYRSYVKGYGIDAVCTKYPEIWADE